MHSPDYNYLIFKYYIIRIQAVLLCALLYSPIFAQDIQEIQIANEYILKGEKEKAVTLYEQLAKKNENVPLIHNNYFNLLLDGGKFAQAEEYVEKLIKRDSKLFYRMDLGIVYTRSGDITKADKYFRALIKAQGDDAYKLKSVADYLAARNHVEYSIVALQQARTAAGNNLYTLELANLYRISGKRDQMVQEYLSYVTQTPANINYVKNLMQILLSKPEELEALERLLYDKVQQNQNSEVFADLLIWVNLQQKNFYGAFIQARAYDKRFKKEQSKALEIAQIALNNNDYDNADKAYAFVIRDYAGTANELLARLGQIQAREAKVKRSYPVNRDSVRYLITQYQNFKNNYPNHPNAFDAHLNQALLYAYYLDQKDSAINNLNSLILNNKVSPNLKAKAKIELGDIYLLKEEPWEATLLYSQVEKSQRETPVGYEAKLKNAKLSYFKGEFLLAQEHLDILKQATTREIANDAIDLSMRIKENTVFDPEGSALKEFASIELLVAQNKTDLALQRLQNFTVTRKVKMSVTEAVEKNLQFQQSQQPDSVWVNETVSTDRLTIKDDVYWLEANLRMKRGEFEIAYNLAEKILTEFSNDILADDAFFLQGELQERYLKNTDKAMEIYRDFLNKYPGSVYAAEARKRYRTLRGDFTEVDSSPKF
ncbi:MAG TPA: tetratricopeptide repeat protein [Cyclobacteriaceae bacterium]|jgi:Flp pilus assembly protein TadD|nr:tetratricopeptide repeat protein [Cytophagales bacterium]HMR56041.1 tetratricopeptide repeat protein [Cyclobacteriaceae bacterium]HNT49537.1 tetratricopeptide repeat protein [Cyclobacteriaceae bacterium]HRE65286.1 tetratricopeptide repeat protein [Cyclobacteriaceae bacterium]HRF34861.1 tetratricopeptide repeat protein [Cyclobacteriaceae bacterium]